MIIDSTKVAADKLAQLEQVLYGTPGGAAPKLPTPDEVIAILGGTSTPSVTVSPSRIGVTVNETYTLSAETVPSGETITWTSSDTDKATVSSAGVVTGKAAGTATITATITVDGTDYTDTCSVVVSAAAQG